MSFPIEQLGREIAEFRERVRALPVGPDVRPDEIRGHLSSRYDFANPRPLEDVTRDVGRMLRDWSLHATHPRYFGLFIPQVHEASIVADTLAALYNVQVGAWWHAPAANEIERLVLDYCGALLGFGPSVPTASFTTGGSEANQTATLAALAHHFPRFAEEGVRALPGQPTLYVSSEAHHSFVKIARATGLGARAVREVPADSHLRLDVAAVERQVLEDHARGDAPFMVVATAGTTGAGVMDPLADAADLCARHGLWLHVDAAWAGSLLFVPRLRPLFDGIERADSVTWDAHKLLSVSMGAGMFFCRHPQAVRPVFDVHTAYVPDEVDGTSDQYRTTMQWSRRFIGLKVFMTLATLGESGMRACLEHQLAMGDYLRGRLVEDGWAIVNDTLFPLVCFTHDSIERRATSVGDVLRRALASRRVWISEVQLGGQRRALRACITSYETGPDDVEALIEELNTLL